MPDPEEMKKAKDALERLKASMGNAKFPDLSAFRFPEPQDIIPPELDAQLKAVGQEQAKARAATMSTAEATAATVKELQLLRESLDKNARESEHLSRRIGYASLGLAVVGVVVAVVEVWAALRC